MTKNISTKNTKAQILDAYEELLKEVQDQKENEPKKIQEEKQKTDQLKKVEDVSNLSIENSIGSLKKVFGVTIEKLNTQLNEGFEQLEEIRSAIQIEKKNLEDLYSLSANTDSLAAMLLVQQEKKTRFEQEMAEKQVDFDEKMQAQQQQWQQEKHQRQTDEKEYDIQLKKQREREQEEYDYQLKISRQKEQDDYQERRTKQEKEIAEKKIAFEQEMAIREKAVKQAEEELAQLRKENKEFPQILEKALVDREKDIAEKLESQFAFESKLSENQYKADLKLKDQIISSLEDKIDAVHTQIQEYAQKATLAESGVKDIAMKAIENSGKIRMISRAEKEDKD